MGAMRLRRTRAARVGSSTAVLFLLGCEVACGQNLPAQKSSQSSPNDLTQVSIENLMNIEVTSVSKREQKLSRAAAAVFVITQEDIRRSGARSIPDVLRMVPGLDVAQVNANTWAVSARGFNRQFANKLLVLIDGRAVYTLMHQGVSWDTQDVPLEDVERIEVIRGPGATVWGANAVNGVINIMTKKTEDTLGALVTGGGGTQEQAFGTTQYGGKFGEARSYRIFAKYLDHDHFPDLNGQNAADGWHLLHGGFRTDGNLSKNDSLTIQGDLYTGSEGASIEHIASIAPPVNFSVNRIGELSGGNVLSRWHHDFANQSETSLQVYLDRYSRSGPESREDRNTFDLDFQHHLIAGRRQDLIWGAGYRVTSDETQGTIDQAWVPSEQTNQLFSTFVQDEITLKPNQIFVTVGTKLEHNDFSGVEIQPGASVAWTPTAHRTFWASVSRASRTTSRDEAAADVGIVVFPGPGGVPAEVVLFGNPHEKAEHVVAFDLGYRAQPIARLSIDIATFFDRYTDLVSHELAPSFVVTSPAPTHLVIPVVNANKMHGVTDGIEVAANWKVTNRWTLSPGYALLQMHLHADSSSQDTTDAPHAEGSSPRHQAQLRSHVKLNRGFAWDMNVYFVDSLPAQQIPSYTRIDTQLIWRIAERLQFRVVGQNLLRDHHAESDDTFTSVNSSQVKRGGYAQFTWRF